MKKKKGATDRAVEECQAAALHKTRFKSDEPLVLAHQCRCILRAAEVDRNADQAQGRVIGDSGPGRPEGDGNTARSVSSNRKGAEVDIQIVSNWLLYNIWEHRWDTQKQRMICAAKIHGRKGWASASTQKQLATLWVADKAIRVMFKGVGHILGLHDYYMPDMDEVAEEARHLR